MSLQKDKESAVQSLFEKFCFKFPKRAAGLVAGQSDSTLGVGIASLTGH